MRPEIRYADSGGYQIAYLVMGDGPLDVVFVFDWGSHIELVWTEPFTERFLKRFASYGRLIMFDMRGMGLSDPVDRLPPLEDAQQDLIAAMDAAGSERAALVGHGHGGQLCMVFAAAHPERTAALVTLNSFARLARARDYPWGLPDDAQEGWLRSIEATWGTGASKQFLAPSMSLDDRLRDMWTAWERGAGGPRRAAAKQRDVFETDVRDVLPMIDTPTLVVQAGDNGMIRPGHGRYLTEHIRGARYLELAYPDHWLWATRDAERMMDEIEEFLTGARGGGERERVLATVTFTDVVRSTEIAARLGDRRWRELLEVHDSVARREIEAARGRLVKSTGDGVLAVFDGPARAIRCVEAIGRGLGPFDLEIRAGVHTGEIEIRDGDIGGIAVHIAARVAALAGGGEVLVSSTVKDLVAGADLEFADRGETELKGVPNTWHLYAVRTAD